MPSLPSPHARIALAAAVTLVATVTAGCHLNSPETLDHYREMLTATSGAAPPAAPTPPATAAPPASGSLSARSSPASSGVAPSASSRSAGPLARRDPCSLLSPEDARELHIPAPGVPVPERSLCGWPVDQPANVGYGVAIVSGAGALPAGTTEMIGTHRAVVLPGKNGTCKVVFAVGDAQVVPIYSNPAVGADLCGRAREFAARIERNL
ncbi:DUF3558 family protein [Amycolatopsis sp. NPDC059021]|uniref:DUF3558 family protein n=1 Tax=Amycolatopsis sp. NPDC059021 TaxID=3346704 RepID=UPI00366E539D